jgi:serine phosphatase RsbU (regulator of sigma subunit)
MEQQKEILKTQLTEYIKGTEQRDDILVVGVRL